MRTHKRTVHPNAVLDSVLTWATKKKKRERKKKKRRRRLLFSLSLSLSLSLYFPFFSFLFLSSLCVGPRCMVSVFILLVAAAARAAFSLQKKKKKKFWIFTRVNHVVAFSSQGVAAAAAAANQWQRMQDSHDWIMHANGYKKGRCRVIVRLRGDVAVRQDHHSWSRPTPAQAWAEQVLWRFMRGRQSWPRTRAIVVALCSMQHHWSARTIDKYWTYYARSHSDNCAIISADSIERQLHVVPAYNKKNHFIVNQFV